MATPLTVQDLLERNKAYISSHQPIPTFAEAGPAGFPHIAILTCVDPRCRPDIFLNLQLSDGVFTFRNICGHASSIIKDIATLDIFVGITDILIVHHTDCGATHYTDEMIRSGLESRLPEDEYIRSTSYGAVGGIEQSIKDDLAIIKASSFIRKELAERTIGLLYDIKTGELKPVEM